FDVLKIVKGFNKKFEGVSLKRVVIDDLKIEHGALVRARIVGGTNLSKSLEKFSKGSKYIVSSVCLEVKFVGTIKVVEICASGRISFDDDEHSGLYSAVNEIVRHSFAEE